MDLLPRFELDSHERYLRGFHEAGEDNADILYFTEHMLMQGFFWGFGAADIIGVLNGAGPSNAELLEWIVSCYHEKESVGGFGGNSKQDICLLHTQHALYVLAQKELLNTLSDETVDKILKYIASLQRDDGGFMNDEFGECDSRFCYCAIGSLKLLYLLQKQSAPSAQSFEDFCSKYGVDLPKAVEFLWRCQNFEGGFGWIRDAESHAASTWTCVAALNLAERLQVPLKTETQAHLEKLQRLASWLSKRQCDSGGFNGRPEKQADVCYSWWVLATLAILGKTDLIDKEKLTNFILHCQDPSGGIADRPDNVGDVFHTFFGFAGLSLLGKLNELIVPQPKERTNTVDPSFALPVRLLENLAPVR